MVTPSFGDPCFLSICPCPRTNVAFSGAGGIRADHSGRPPGHVRGCGHEGWAVGETAAPVPPGGGKPKRREDLDCGNDQRGDVCCMTTLSQSLIFSVSFTVSFWRGERALGDAPSAHNPVHIA